jgi:hypothetical protein
VCGAPVVQNGRVGEWRECWGVVLWTAAYKKPDILNMVRSNEELYDLCFSSNIIRVLSSWIRASVDYSVKIPTRCSFVKEFIIPKFFEGSTCFERHTAHHQEL